MKDTSETEYYFEIHHFVVTYGTVSGVSGKVKVDYLE